jgi:2-dehydro-3-deoxyphosphogluconate aldolase/(4S)-4-hydroxy-2-oxoglutarate aldolase
MFEVEIVPGETVRPFLGVVRGPDDDGEPHTVPLRPPSFDWEGRFGRALRSDRVVAVLRAPRYGAPRLLAEGLVRGGVRIIEFTLTGQDALDAIRVARDVPDAMVGAGSVLTPDQARQAVAAGARFLVSPIGALEIAAVAGNVPVFLAGRTPTELYRAWALTGAPVKLFPANLDGPGYVRSLLAPMPDLAIMPSGGVDAGNLGDYLRAGAVAVNIGDALCPPELLSAGDGDALTPRARQIRAAIAAV